MAHFVILLVIDATFAKSSDTAFTECNLSGLDYPRSNNVTHEEECIRECRSKTDCRATQSIQRTRRTDCMHRLAKVKHSKTGASFWCKGDADDSTSSKSDILPSGGGSSAIETDSSGVSGAGSGRVVKANSISIPGVTTGGGNAPDSPLTDWTAATALANKTCANNWKRDDRDCTAPATYSDGICPSTGCRDTDCCKDSGKRGPDANASGPMLMVILITLGLFTLASVVVVVVVRNWKKLSSGKSLLFVPFAPAPIVPFAPVESASVAPVVKAPRKKHDGKRNHRKMKSRPLRKLKAPADSDIFASWALSLSWSASSWDDKKPNDGKDKKPNDGKDKKPDDGKDKKPNDGKGARKTRS